MKKTVMLLALLALALPAFAADIELPTPNKEGGMPLMEALAARKSNRRVAGATPTQQQLADLLWAANGVTRPDGKRTAPSAMNRREIELAVLTAEGLFHYNPAENTLTELAPAGTAEDVRRGASAIVLLHFHEKTSGQSREAALVDAGFVGQNLYLFCTSQGWANVFVGTVDRTKFTDLLGCTEQEILFAHKIGISKK